MGAPVILITGALTGIGRATELAFAKKGTTVVVSGRREAEGKALENKLRSLGAEAAFILADVRCPASGDLAPRSGVQPIVAARPKRTFIRTVHPAAMGGQRSFGSSSEFATLRQQPF
jgi:NAD(P)-dependent dehydrogenase (short-subunit alcohol dehydrogenase family)